MKKLTGLLLIAIVTVALNAASALANNEQLAREVMDIHDVAMAKMTTMHELKLQLQELVEKEGLNDKTAQSIESLKQAHRAMMQWMREYKKDQTDLTAESRKVYLLEEKVKIQKVSDMINKSIGSSESLLAGSS